MLSTSPASGGEESTDPPSNERLAASGISVEASGADLFQRARLLKSPKLDQFHAAEQENWIPALDGPADATPGQVLAERDAG